MMHTIRVGIFHDIQKNISNLKICKRYIYRVPIRLYSNKSDNDQPAGNNASNADNNEIPGKQTHSSSIRKPINQNHASNHPSNTIEDRQSTKNDISESSSSHRAEKDDFNTKSKNSSNKIDANDDYLLNQIRLLNQSVSEHPRTSAISFLLMRNATWFMLTAFYGFFPGIVNDIGSELAVGYLVAKFTGKFRTAPNIALAAYLANQFPLLSEFKVSHLFTGGMPLHDTNKPENNTSQNIAEERRRIMIQMSQKGKDDATQESIQKLERFQKWIVGPIDTYGFSLFIAGKVNILGTIVGTAAALKYGVDISSWLAALGGSLRMICTLFLMVLN